MEEISVILPDRGFPAYSTPHPPLPDHQTQLPPTNPDSRISTSPNHSARRATRRLLRVINKRSSQTHRLDDGRPDKHASRILDMEAPLTRAIQYSSLQRACWSISTIHGRGKNEGKRNRQVIEPGTRDPTRSICVLFQALIIAILVRCGI